MPVARHDASPKPFVWTRSAEAILAKLNAALYYLFDFGALGHMSEGDPRLCSSLEACFDWGRNR